MVRKPRKKKSFILKPSHTIVLVIMLAITGAALFSLNKKGILDTRSRASGNETIFVPQEIPMSESEISNPFHGYFTWSNTDEVPNMGPSHDAYARYTWRDFETTQGVYDFTKLENEIAKHAALGKKYSFRVRLMKGYGDNTVWIPDYLKSYGWWYDDNKDGTVDTFIPDWNNSYVLSRMSSFFQALGAKYNKDPRVNWVEIGQYGQYGEWSLSYRVDYTKAPSGVVRATDDTKRKYVDMVVNAFPNKRVIMMAGGKEATDAVQYAMSLHPGGGDIGWRFDCLGLINDATTSYKWRNHWEDLSTYAQWPSLQDRWKTAPVIAEYCTIITGAQTATATSALDAALQDVKTYHVGYVGNGNFITHYANLTPEEQRDAMMVGKTAGYRYLIKKVAVSPLMPGQNFYVNVDWLNIGVAPAYEKWDVFLQVRNNGEILWQNTLNIDLQKLLPTGTTPVQSSNTFTLPSSVPPGNYEVFVTINDPSGYRKPLALANLGRNAYGRYLLGRVDVIAPTVTPMPSVTPIPTTIPTDTPPPSPTLMPTALPTHTPIPTATVVPTKVPTLIPTLIPTVLPPSGGTGLLGYYFDEMDFRGIYISRIDPVISFNFDSASPDSRIDDNTFSARWTGYLVPSVSATYTLYVSSDDGARLWLNGNRVINAWNDHSIKTYTTQQYLRAGTRYPIRLEYYEKYGKAAIKLEWSSSTMNRQVVPQSVLYSP